MLNSSNAAAQNLRLSPERAISPALDVLEANLHAALGAPDAWQAEWLPIGQRVLLRLKADVVSVLDGVTSLAESGGHASVFEVWHGPASSVVIGDLLLLDGEDVRAEQLNVRRRLLEEVVRGRGLVLAGYAAPQLADIVRAPSWRTLGIAHSEATRHGMRGLVFRSREGRYGEQPIVRWPTSGLPAPGVLG